MTAARKATGLCAVCGESPRSLKGVVGTSLNLCATCWNAVDAAALRYSLSISEAIVRAGRWLDHDDFFANLQRRTQYALNDMDMSWDQLKLTA